MSPFLAALSLTGSLQDLFFLNDLESRFALETPLGTAPAVPLPPAKSESVCRPQLCHCGPYKLGGSRLLAWQIQG